MRFIDRAGSDDSALQVSGVTCNETWGRRFDPHTPVNPIITSPLAPDGQDTLCVRHVDFVSKFPTGDPSYPLAAGALNFTLTLGTSCGGHRVLKFNGVYNGEGGEWPLNHTSLPSECDNLWLYLPSPRR